MSIPTYLLDGLERHLRAGRRSAVVVRHAERHPVFDLRNHEEVLLTERGHEQAIEGGKALSRVGRRIRILHSPVERCAQTARGLLAGARALGAEAEIVCAIAALGSPFVKDRKRAFELVTRTGPRFIRDWFDGRLPPEVFEPRSSAARAQIDVVTERLLAEEAGTLEVFVSHDWNIALVREELLGVTPESTWPGYLDGVTVALDDPDVVVELDGREGRRAWLPRRG
jgi:broad specificity phosphatase PhoE